MSGIADLLGPPRDRAARSRGIPDIRLAAWPGHQKPFLPTLTSSKAPDGTTRPNVPR